MQSRMEIFGKFDKPQKYIARARAHERQAKTYELNSLPALLLEIKANKERSLQFIVDNQCNVRLARASKATHIEMTSPENKSALCISAGNLIFDEHYKLVEINNFSPRFRPHFSSIKWLFVALMSAHEELGLNDYDEIILELDGLATEHLEKPAQEDLILYTNNSLFTCSMIGILCVTVGEMKQYVDQFKPPKELDIAENDYHELGQKFNLSRVANGFFELPSPPSPSSPFKHPVNRTLKF
ncbi:MAG: hypothetical protein J0I93_03565 [Legionella sp.]|nr:hypothetical protein [Legionella sp.]